jgi:hypothetical protein
MKIEKQVLFIVKYNNEINIHFKFWRRSSGELICIEDISQKTNKGNWVDIDSTPVTRVLIESFEKTDEYKQMEREANEFLK